MNYGLDILQLLMITNNNDRPNYQYFSKCPIMFNFGSNLFVGIIVVNFAHILAKTVCPANIRFTRYGPFFIHPDLVVVRNFLENALLVFLIMIILSFLNLQLNFLFQCTINLISCYSD